MCTRRKVEEGRVDKFDLLGVGKRVLDDGDVLDTVDNLELCEMSVANTRREKDNVLLTRGSRGAVGGRLGGGSHYDGSFGGKV